MGIIIPPLSLGTGMGKIDQSLRYDALFSCCSFSFNSCLHINIAYGTLLNPKQKPVMFNEGDKLGTLLRSIRIEWEYVWHKALLIILITLKTCDLFILPI